MTDKAYAVPLQEQLANVPRNARLVIDDADGMGTSFIPVGRICHEAAEALRARLAQPETVIQARKEGNLIVVDLPQVPTGSGGISKDTKREPILPGGSGGSGVPTIDGWPLYSGLPPIKVQDEREENYKSFAQSAQVLGAQHDPRREPSGSWASWDNTMCNPLANARMQTQSAWQDGYNSAKAEWVELTDKDREWCDEHSHGNTSGAKQKAYGRAIEAKLKEKNYG